MDARRFDALARALSTASRRGVLGLLFTLPVVGGLLAILGIEETEAKGRRKRRKKRHKHGKGNGRHRKGKRKGKCRRKSRARICAGKCGIVKNKKTCKKRVNCGSCACEPPCPVCQRCEGAPGACVPDAALNGQPCGGPNKVCEDGVCVQTCLPPTADLQQAITDTPVGQTLTLCAGTRDLSAAVAITQNLTLRGAGAEQTSLTGQGTALVLTIAEGITVTLQDLTITGGAGGMTNAGDLTLRDVTVTDNTADNGGGIFNNSTGTLTLEDGSRITGNTAASDGGGILNFDGTVILQPGSVVGGNTAADANTARLGGGIFSFGDGTVTLHDDSRVAGNAATDVGGGIFNVGTLTLEDGSQVTGNTATNGGGGIYSDLGSEVTVGGGAFVCDNQPSNDQCAGSGTYTGDCPNPGETCPPA